MSDIEEEKIQAKMWIKSVLSRNIPIFEQVVVEKFIQEYGNLTPETFHHARIFIHNFSYCYGYKLFLRELLKTIDEDDNEEDDEKQLAYDNEIDQFVLQLALQYSNFNSVESQRDALKSLFELIVKD